MCGSDSPSTLKKRCEPQLDGAEIGKAGESPVEALIIAGSMDLEMLSQGDSAICFAYATADMISQRVQTEISALDVATKYYLTNPSRLRNWLIRICSSSPRNGGLSDSDCRKPEHNRCLERR